MLARQALDEVSVLTDFVDLTLMQLQTGQSEALVLTVESIILEKKSPAGVVYSVEAERNIALFSFGS